MHRCPFRCSYARRVKRAGGGRGSKKERRQNARQLKRQQLKSAVLIEVRSLFELAPRSLPTLITPHPCPCPPFAQSIFRGYCVRMYAWAVRYLLSPDNITNAFNRVVSDCGVDGGLDRIGMVKLLRMLGVATGFDKADKEAWNVRRWPTVSRRVRDAVETHVSPPSQH